MLEINIRVCKLEINVWIFEILYGGKGIIVIYKIIDNLIFDRL